ncbi:MAG: 50S ribosomal protein L17 [Patescibacteria group bacterium]|jgi:large subunit ribosomal protein L17|nr:50S ribosomal protein L17 [Patescibacteria group bacterium]
MRHLKKGRKLDRKKAPREALLKNLAQSLILYEKIETTEAKAKEMRSIVEKMITIGKENNLTTRRHLISLLPTKNAVDKVLEVLGPKYKDRPGGYTRIVKIGPRQGDGAKIVQISLV